MAHLTIIVTLQLVTFSFFKEHEISYKTLLILQLFKNHNFLIVLENKNPRKEKNLCAMEFIRVTSDKENLQSSKQ